MDDVVWFNQGTEFDNPTAIESLKSSFDTCMESYHRTKVWKLLTSFSIVAA